MTDCHRKTERGNGSELETRRGCKIKALGLSYIRFCPNSRKCFFPSVENESHCDFVKLREMLIRVNMEDLREQTHARHYELYRRCKLEEMGFKDTDPDSQPFR